MNIFAYGIDPMVVNDLKANDYNAVFQANSPDPEMVSGQVFLVSSEVVEVSQLQSFRETYSNCVMIYHYLTPGLRGYMHVHALCESLQIHFLSPRSSQTTLLDLLRLIFDRQQEEQRKLIGVFGSGQGIGCTSWTRTMAKILSSKGFSILVLGLDLYDPGWTGRPAVSLDQWRPRITGKVLQKEDFDGLVEKDGFRYLPGNFDLISSLDYQEEEIEYLLDIAQAQEHYDLILADFGSIPESAAWYAGLQKSAFRYYVSHPGHDFRVKSHLEIFEHLQIKSEHFFLVANHADQNALLAPKSFAEQIKMNLAVELPHYPGTFGSYTLPLGKRDLGNIDVHLESMLVSLGMRKPEVKKGIRTW